MNKILTLGLLVSFASGISNAAISYSPLKASDNNIDGGALNFSDVDEEDIISYYDGVEGLKGEELKDELTQIIDTDYYITYSNLWNWMKITDRDWDISNEIKESTYNFNRDSSYYFRNLYATYNGDPDRATSNANNSDGSYVDREHCYPKSFGFKFEPYATSTGNGYLPPAGTDLHHLITSDHNNNNAHSNYAFGNVDTTRSYTVIEDRDSQDVNTASGLKGYSALEGNSSYTVYEPMDEYKGDVARACLYMATRYNAKTDISSENPQLHLTDDLSLLETQTLGDVGGIGYYGELTTLLEWNEEDPVDYYEIHRNNLIYNNVQANRNPYVDHPEWAEIVYDEDYSGEGAVNSSPAEPEDAYGIDSVVEPEKKEFSLGEEFTCDGLEVYAHDSEGNESVMYSTDESLLININVDTKKLGEQTVTLNLFSSTYDLYDIYVTNEDAVIGEGEGQVTADEQASAFADYVLEIGAGNTESREIYEKLKEEYYLMDDSAIKLFNAETEYQESFELFQTIKSNNMTSQEQFEEYLDYLLDFPLYFAGLIVIVILIILAIVLFPKITKKIRRR